jgi:hypothetical protein|tara:strand:- start:70 stop:423 length:354 start_codon:yes stop_codon:yes gene_type:complete
MTDDITEFLNPDSISYIYYSEDAKVLTKDEDVGKACAYIMIREKESEEENAVKKEFYYVKVLRGHLFDPQGMDSNKITSIHVKFDKVSGKTFDHYIKYLAGKKSNEFTWAEREYTNG